MKSTINYKLLTVNYKLLFPGGPIPHNMAGPLIGPPTLEQSGSEHRRAVFSLSPEERGLGVRGGAFLKGKEGRVGFRKKLFFHDYFKCLEDQLYIIPEAGILYILQIEFDLFLHDYMNIIILRISSLLHQFILISELDASRISNARSYIQHMHLLWSPIVYIVANLWSWTHKTHVTNKHVNQLRKFIKLVLSDVITRAGNSRIPATDGDQGTLISPYSHRTELENAEIPVMSSHSHLAVEHRSLAIQLDPDSQNQKKRTQNNESAS